MPKPASAKGGLANIQLELGKLMTVTGISIPHLPSIWQPLFQGRVDACLHLAAAAGLGCAKEALPLDPHEKNAVRMGQVAIFNLTRDILGAARLVERAFGLGACPLTEAVRLVGELLKAARARIGDLAWDQRARAAAGGLQQSCTSSDARPRDPSSKRQSTAKSYEPFPFAKMAPNSPFASPLIPSVK